MHCHTVHIPSIPIGCGTRYHMAIRLGFGRITIYQNTCPTNQSNKAPVHITLTIMYCPQMWQQTFSGSLHYAACDLIVVHGHTPVRRITAPRINIYLCPPPPSPHTLHTCVPASRPHPHCCTQGRQCQGQGQASQGSARAAASSCINPPPSPNTTCAAAFVYKPSRRRGQRHSWAVPVRTLRALYFIPRDTAAVAAFFRLGFTLLAESRCLVALYTCSLSISIRAAFRAVCRILERRPLKNPPKPS